MAITFVSGSYVEATSGTYTIDKPVGVQDGDVLVLMGIYGYTGADNTISAPPGFTTLHSAARSGSLPAYVVAYRGIVTAGSEPSSYSGSTSLNTVHVRPVVLVALRGVDSVSPIIGSTVNRIYTFSAADPVTLAGVTAPGDGGYAVALYAGPASAASPSSSPTLPVLHRGDKAGVLGQQQAQAQVQAGYSVVTSGALSRAASLVVLRPAGGDPPGPTAKPWTEAFVVE